uniref:uncharacterized protein isoform X3 n=1 Tax=Pristiophorus japonicus TaxID=55135 RepID=UPI00398F773B
MARETEEDAANAVYQRSRECMETAGASKKMFLYNGPLKKSQDLPMIQSHELQEKKQITCISGTGPDMRTLSRTTDITLEMKWSSKSKENQMNRVAHNSQNKEDEFDF